MPARPEHQVVFGPLPAHPTVREVAYRRLRQLILNGTLSPGERIFETGLAETVDWFLDNEWWWRPIREGKYRGERLGSAA